MTQLRQRMVEDMTVRQYSERTIKRYVECVAAFARHFGRCPSLPGPEEIRQYPVHLAVDLKRSFTTLDQTVCALRFLFRVTLPRRFPIDLIPHARHSKKLPMVLSREEVEALLEVPNCEEHRAIIATFYSTGVRLSELRCLATADSGGTSAPRCPRCQGRMVHVCELARGEMLPRKHSVGRAPPSSA